MIDISAKKVGSNSLKLALLLTVGIGLLSGEKAMAERYQLSRGPGKTGIINEKGELVYPAIFDAVHMSRGEPWWVILKKSDEKILVVKAKPKGGFEEKTYDSLGVLGSSSFPYFEVILKGKVGYLNRDGVEIIRPIYDQILRRIVGAVLIQGHKKGLYFFGGERSWPILPAEYDEIDGNSNYPIEVRKNGKIGLVNNDGTFAIPVIFDKIERAYVGTKSVFLVQKGNYWGVYSGDQNSQNVKELLPAVYSTLHAHRDTNENSFFAEKNGLWGLIKLTSSTSIPFVYDRIIEGWGQTLVAVRKGRKVLVNLKGTEADYYNYSDRKTVEFGGGILFNHLFSSPEPIDEKLPPIEGSASSQQKIALLAYNDMSPFEIAHSVVKEILPQNLSVFIQNKSDLGVSVASFDGYARLGLQALSPEGEWTTVISTDPSLGMVCGNSHIPILLPPKSQMVTGIPRFSGEFKTSFRVFMDGPEGLIYSNIYPGSISKKVFIKSKPSEKQNMKPPNASSSVDEFDQIARDWKSGKIENKGETFRKLSQMDSQRAHSFILKVVNKDDTDLIYDIIFELNNHVSNSPEMVLDLFKMTALDEEQKALLILSAARNGVSKDKISELRAKLKSEEGRHNWMVAMTYVGDIKQTELFAKALASPRVDAYGELADDFRYLKRFDLLPLLLPWFQKTDVVGHLGHHDSVGYTSADLATSLALELGLKPSKNLSKNSMPFTPPDHQTVKESIIAISKSRK